jgi:hypothetical protein
MKKIRFLLACLSSLILLSSCSMPTVIVHPNFAIKPAYIVGKWILPFDKTDPPLYDTLTHQFIGTPDYEVLYFKSDGTFSVEVHKKGKVSILRKKDLRWWIRTSENITDKGPAVALTNMRFYPSELTGVQDYTPADPNDDYVPNNPEELIIQIGPWFSKDPDDLYLSFEDGDVDLYFTRETHYKEK